MVYPRKIDYNKVKELYCKGYSHNQIAKDQNTTPNSINRVLNALKNKGEIKRRLIDWMKQGENHNRSKLTESQVRAIIKKKRSAMYL